MLQSIEDTPWALLEWLTANLERLPLSGSCLKAPNLNILKNQSERRKSIFRQRKAAPPIAEADDRAEMSMGRL